MDPNGHQLELEEEGRRVEIAIDGVVVATSTEAITLRETGLPPRYYLPRADVRTDLFHPTDKSTHCPFKGDASYWSLDVGGRTHVDVVWSYAEPIPAMAGIAGRLCFFDERVDVTIDGERQARPETQWTPGIVPAEHP